MSRHRIVEDISETAVTVSAIASLTYLAHIGVTDLSLVFGIAGLGGYNLLKHYRTRESISS